jgi:hypothetical protein
MSRELTENNLGSLNRDYRILSDRRMKLFLEQFLLSQGWRLEVPMNLTNGNDIEARRDNRKWNIEIKGVNIQAVEPTDSFLSGLGKILMKMDIPENKYSVAIPDTGPFYRLWKRLPLLVKERTGITALFVNPCGQVRESFEE